MNAYLNTPSLNRQEAELMMSIYGGMLGGEILGAAKGAYQLGKACTVANDAANFSREINAADLGIKGTVEELSGTLSVNDGLATARIDMISGEIQNPLQIIGNLTDTARASGATTLRIEGTIANERLYYVLQNRYGLTSQGAVDSITIPLR